MPNTKISNLTSASALSGTEVLPIVQSGSTKKTTTQDIADLASGGFPTALIYFEFTAPGFLTYTVAFNNTGSVFALGLTGPSSGNMNITSSLPIINSKTFVSMNAFRDRFNFPTFTTAFMAQASVSNTTTIVLQITNGDGANYNLSNAVTQMPSYIQIVFYP